MTTNQREDRDRPESPQNSSPTERVLFGAIGAGLIALSLRQRGTVGVLLAAGGALLVAGAAMGQGLGEAVTGVRRTQDDQIKVEKAITVGLGADELYTFWRDFENLPRFMDHLESVKVGGGDGQRSHWVAKAPVGTTVEWDAEITADEPGRRIAWRSLEGATVPNEGAVEFRPAPGDRGTEIHVSLTYRPPGGTLGATVARLLGEDPNIQIEHDLRRLKRLLEVGHIPTTEGQSSGRKGAMKAEAKMYDNRRTS
ncbi:SRPBCC family protein [Deinococcus sp. MIMF12]|uniref:SRPBCC family protein n=1 Tax=Deinococcus rhizophilus TaxID=3049544 RepID=A0ABT7JI07_9DEIO|nr:SRPBCC family protein [Deinococcus rhizophilus]MDL2344120.1 SRPBCC family protein [Deinococcus rhizophilus]